MDQVLTAIRAHCEAQGLRPWTLARETGIPLSGWQRILDGAEPGKVTHERVMAAAEALGIQVKAKRPR